MLRTMEIITEVQISIGLKILKKLCKRGIHNSFVARYETTVGEFWAFFIGVLGVKTVDFQVLMMLMMA